MRTVVVDTPGAGKTTLARRIAAQLQLPHIELDAINWQSEWRDLTRHDPEEFVRRVTEAIQAEGTGAADEFLLAATVQNLRKLARFLYRPSLTSRCPA
jgi:adenylate kinase family enzyme